jgi:hypothetical protein
MTKIKHPVSKRDRLKIAEKKKLDAEKKATSGKVRRKFLEEIKEKEADHELRAYADALALARQSERGD